MSVYIDLRDLTERDLETALATCGDKMCYYATPCIIGTLIPPENRQMLDEADVDETDVRTLFAKELIDMPPAQLPDAKALQEAYDTGDKETLAALARKYIARGVTVAKEV